jgi:hypothetical protein
MKGLAVAPMGMTKAAVSVCVAARGQFGIMRRVWRGFLSVGWPFLDDASEVLYVG